MINVDPRKLRDAFGSFMTGVTVVTTMTREGNPVGFTANSFTSVSLDPPMLLVCPGKYLSCFDIFENCDYFAVNILSADQQEVSDIFAKFNGDRFQQVSWQKGHMDMPLLDASTAQFICKKSKAIPAGDHSILLGEVHDFKNSGQPGLGYAGGTYFTLNDE
ncbi:flavin reductase family protein [Curvivirga aplysinae]|uniref:flavin reductase family protein n=1 Tax=Curvivirga aplysinae TaxID=2529852 RepID=UPI0012BB9F43|nr:flavin reductase family protein [Curvivirga aplysinae]MTI10091.1 flavin reductase [Curvivirga aplysinae]